VEGGAASSINIRIEQVPLMAHGHGLRERFVEAALELILRVADASNADYLPKVLAKCGEPNFFREKGVHLVPTPSV
jgi:hypothetical protein